MGAIDGAGVVSEELDGVTSFPILQSHPSESTHQSKQLARTPASLPSPPTLSRWLEVVFPTIFCPSIPSLMNPMSVERTSYPRFLIESDSRPVPAPKSITRFRIRIGLLVAAVLRVFVEDSSEVSVAEGYDLILSVVNGFSRFRICWRYIDSTCQFRIDQRRIDGRPRSQKRVAFGSQGEELYLSTEPNRSASRIKQRVILREADGSIRREERVIEHFERFRFVREKRRQSLSHRCASSAQRSSALICNLNFDETRRISKSKGGNSARLPWTASMSTKLTTGAVK